MSAVERFDPMQPENRTVADVVQQPEIIRLVTATVERTGESMETVIEMALQERLERLPPPEPEPDVMTEERRERVYALVRKMQQQIKESGVEIPDPDTYLYGEDGLPR